MSLSCAIKSLFTSEVSDLRNPALWLHDAIGGGRTAAGENVGPASALTLSSYYAGLRVVSEDISWLPLQLFEKTPQGRKQLPNHPIARLLNLQPNKNMTSMSFRATLTSHAMSWFGGFAEIQENGRGDPIALHPIHPSRVNIRMINGEIFYDVKVPTGIKIDLKTGVPANVIRFPQEKIFHISGLGGDGITGYSVLRIAMESLGVALAQQTFAATFFGNGSTIGGLLEHPEKLEDEDYERLRESWSEVHQGPYNAHRVAILEEGMKWSKTGVPPKDAQLLEARMFSIEEVARWFRLSPVKIGHNQNVPFANISSLQQAHVNDALMPWMIRWEQEIKRKLIAPREKNVFAKHNVNALLRGEPKARMEFLTGMVKEGLMSANEAREKEDLNPSPDQNANKLFKPLNMAPLDTFGQEEQGASTAGGNMKVISMDLEPQFTQEELFCKEVDKEKPIFLHAAGICVNKEIKVYERLCKKHKGDKATFIRNIQEFYGEFEGDIGHSFEPVMAVLTKTAEEFYLSDRIKPNNKAANYPSEYVEMAFERAIEAFEANETFLQENLAKTMAYEMIERVKNTIKEL